MNFRECHKNNLKVERPQYRDVLIHELQSRISRNAAYSLRSFARDIGLAPSGLSRILSGQQGISIAKAKTIAEKLELGSVESDYFCALVAAEHGRSSLQREEAKKKLESPSVYVTEISLQYFKAISDWHYFAIIELTTVSDFDSDPEWIALRLGIKPNVVKEAVARLLKLGLIAINENGKYSKTKDFRATPHDIPSRALRSHHQQFLKKAETALFEQSVSAREFSSITFAMNQSDLAWAKKEMKKFRRGLTKRLSDRIDKNRLYQFSMQLYALDQKSDPTIDKKETK